METQRVMREEKEEIEEIIKITVTKEAGENLTEILAMVNEGFGAGKVNRQDIASWIIDRFKKSFSDSDIQQIRKDFFSEKVLLESILKQAKASGDVPDFLREALKKYLHLKLDDTRSMLETLNEKRDVLRPNFKRSQG